MKKVFLVCFAFAGVLFTSCNKDDDQSPEETLSGSWQLTAELDNGEAYELDNCDKELTIVFNPDGTYDYIEYDPVEGNENECVVSEEDSESGSWSVPSEGTLMISDGTFSVSMEYNIDGSELTLTIVYEDGDESYTSVQVFKRK